MNRIVGVVVGIAALAGGGLLVAGERFVTAPTPRIAQSVTGQSSQDTALQGLQTVALKIDNMSCASCPMIVRRTLEDVEGVTRAKVSFRDKTAIVTYDAAKCAPRDLLAATARNGFPSTMVR